MGVITTNLLLLISPQPSTVCSYIYCQPQNWLFFSVLLFIFYDREIIVCS